MSPLVLQPEQGARFPRHLGVSVHVIAAVSTGLCQCLLAGCMLGPDYHPASPPESAHFTRSETVDRVVNDGSAKAPDAPAASDNWWQAYGSPHIDELVGRTLTHNPNLQAGLASLRQAQENVNAQRGLFYPQVEAGVSDQRQRTGKILQSSLNSGASTFNLHTAQLNISLIPDVFGANARQVESLAAIVANNRHQLDALRLSLTSNVVAAGLQEQLLIELRRLVQESIEVSQALTAQAHTLNKIGYTGLLDVAIQEAGEAATTALLPPIDKQLEQTRDLIAVLCGDLPADARTAAESEALQIPTYWPKVLPSNLVARRPDVLAAADNVQSANALIGVAKAARFPLIQLSGNLAFTNTTLDGLFSAGSTQIGTLADSVAVPLFAGGTLAARQRAAVAATEAARAQYEAVVLSAFQNVADSLYALDQDGNALRAAEASQLAAYRQLEVIQRQAEKGYVAKPTLLIARLNELQARINLNQSRGTYLGDTVALYQAIGGDLK